MISTGFPAAMSALLLLCGADPCFAGTGAADAATSATGAQLLADPGFAKGFNLLGIRSVDTGGAVFDVLDYGKPAGGAPAWRLAQWGTRHSLQGAKPETVGPGVFRYANAAKAVTADPARGELTLAVHGSQEYPAPRKANEEWPHLLAEQYFETKPLLKDLREVRMKFDVRLSRFADRMTTETRDPGLHAAQLQIYLMVQNVDASSGAHGDYFWFGLPLFDNREEMPKEVWHKDGGKADTTHKFIYLMPADAYLKRGLGDGKPAAVDVDVLPFINRARSLAQEGGFLAGTMPDQLALTGVNVGWELPGTFDVEATIRGLEIRAARRSGE